MLKHLVASLKFGNSKVISPPNNVVPQNWFEVIMGNSEELAKHGHCNWGYASWCCTLPHKISSKYPKYWKRYSGTSVRGGPDVRTNREPDRPTNRQTNGRTDTWDDDENTRRCPWLPRVEGNLLSLIHVFRTGRKSYREQFDLILVVFRTTIKVLFIFVFERAGGV